MNQNWALNGVDGVDLSIFENIGSLTILFSLKGKILYTNSMCSEELGYHLEDLQEMKIWDLIPKEELKRFKEKITYIQENKDTASLTIDLLNKQADRTAYSSTLSMTKHNGDKMLILGIFRGIIQLDIEQEIIAQKSQLNEEKLMLKRIIEKNPYGVCIFDKKGDYLDSNDNFKHLWGGKVFENYNILSDKSLFNGSDNSNPLEIIENTNFSKDILFNPSFYNSIFEDHSFWVQVTLFCVKSVDNGILFLVGMFKNINESVENKKSLQEYQNHLENLVEERTNALKEEQITLNKIIENNPYAIIIFDEDGYFVKSNAAFKEIFPLKIDSSYCFFKDPYFAKDQIWLSLKQTQEGEVINIPEFEFDFQKYDPQYPPGRYILRAKSFPIYTNGSNVQNFVLMLEDVTAKHVAEKEKEISEEKYHGMFENSVLGIAVLEENGQFLEINDKFSKMMEYSVQELKTKRAQDLIANPENKKALYEYLSSSSILDNFEVELRKKNGNAFWALIYSRLIEFEGKSAYIATALDISDRKNVEKDLKEQESLFRLIFQNTPLPMMIFDDLGNIVKINLQFFVTFGYKKEEIQTQQLWMEKAYPDPDYRKNVMAIWQSDMKQLKTESYIKRVLNIHGRYGNVHEVELIKLNLEENSNLMILDDLTEYNKVQRKILASEEKYRILVETSKDFIFQLDLENKFTFINRAFTKILGYSFEEIRNKNIAQIVIPEDRRILNYITKSLTDKKPFDRLEFRVVTKTGVVIYLSTNIQPIINENAEVKAVFGIARDITDEIQAQYELERSEEKYRRVVETSSDIIFVSDLEGNYLFLNSANSRILGFDLEELMEINGFSLFHPEDKSHVQEELKPLFQGERVYNIEYRFRKKDGKYIYLSTNGSPIFDENGNVTAMLGAARDISELKQKELEIREKEMRIQHSSVTSMVSSMLVQGIGRVRENINAILKTIGNSIGGGMILLLRHIQSGSAIRFEIEGEWRAGSCELGDFYLNQLLTHQKFHENIINLPTNIYSLLNQDKLNEILGLHKNETCNIEEMVLIPIFQKGKRYGTFMLLSKEENYYDQRKIVLCLNLALLMGLGLENASNQEILNILFETSTKLEIGIIIIQKDEKKNHPIKFMNSHFYKLANLTKKQADNLTLIGDILQPEIYQKLDKMREARKLGQDVPLTYRIKLKLGGKERDMIFGMTDGILDSNPAIIGFMTEVNLMKVQSIEDLLQLYQIE